MQRVFFVICLLSGPAFADLRMPDSFGFPKWRPEWERKWNATYRMGDEWGKVKVTSTQIGKETKEFARAAKSTASVRGGTAFYLGKFDGRHVLATNYHVMETAESCASKPARFPWLELEKPLECDLFLGSWSDIDLALFTVKATEKQEEELLSVKGNFKWDADIYPGQELITIGFGVADNPWREMVANQDSDCKVFSGRNDFRFMNDPDELNPGPYKAWSFANGCDVSHGDSGSAMVDRKTGDVVGIIWTGRIPKDSKVQSSKYLDELFKAQDEEIWKHLSYSVPASKMKAHLEKVIEGEDSAAEIVDTLRELIK